MIQELNLQPGELGALLAARGLAPRPGSSGLDSDLLEPAGEPRPAPELEGLDDALSVLARPQRIVAGRRGARRMEPWPFFLYQADDATTVLLAPEGGGYGRLRFRYTEPELIDWLAEPFRRFAAPEIGCPELPPLTPEGLSVLLAIVDLFRHRYPELDPDWAETEPILFGLPELTACLTASLDDPSAVWSGLAGLGLPRPCPLDPAQVESLLYVFANEGYLEADLTHDEPYFRITEPFLGVPLSLAWWDLSLSLELAQGKREDSLRLLQGLALWSFETLEDGRLTMTALSGQAVEDRLRGLLYGHSRPPLVKPAPPAPPPQLAEFACTSCGHPLSAHAKFCGGCGNRVQRDHCLQCGHPLEVVGAKFCPECGAKQ